MITFFFLNLSSNIIIPEYDFFYPVHTPAVVDYSLFYFGDLSSSLAVIFMEILIY
jgi:hypothetical protein